MLQLQLLSRGLSGTSIVNSLRPHRAGCGGKGVWITPLMFFFLSDLPPFAGVEEASHALSYLII